MSSADPGPVPDIAGRVDVAPLADVVAWARHPYRQVADDGVVDAVLDRLTLELEDARRQAANLRVVRFPFAGVVVSVAIAGNWMALTAPARGALAELVDATRRLEDIATVGPTT